MVCDPSACVSGNFVMVTGISSCYPSGVGCGRQIYATDVQLVRQ